MRAALDYTEKQLKKVKTEKEEEIQRLSNELQAAKAINERLTRALLDNIGKHIFLIVLIPTVMAAIPSSACVTSNPPVKTCRHT